MLVPQERHAAKAANTRLIKQRPILEWIQAERYQNVDQTAATARSAAAKLSR